MSSERSLSVRRSNKSPLRSNIRKTYKQLRRETSVNNSEVSSEDAYRFRDTSKRKVS